MREITVEQLEDMKSSGKKVLVDFKAKWCGPCQQLIPKLTMMSERFEGVEFVMIDVDDNREKVLEMGIRSVPTVMIFNGEYLLLRVSGVKSDETYEEILKTL